MKPTFSTRQKAGRLIRQAVLISLLAPAAMALADPLESPKRVELKRTDLSGAPGMEVVESVTEYVPGDTIPAHIHHGVEAGYVLQGTMVQSPGKPANMIETGSPILNLRDVKHGGYTVVGPGTLKLYTVHIVDKGKPLYDSPTNQ